MRHAVDANGPLEQLHVHPVGLPATAGGGAEFFADVTDLVENIPLGLKLFCTDIRLVHFCDAPYFAHGGSGDAVQNRAAHGAVRRGDERVVAPVDVESESLRAFGENADILFVQNFFRKVDEIRFECRHLISAHAGAAVLIAIRGAVAASGRADFLVNAVFGAMRRGDGVRIARDEYHSLRLDAAALQRADFAFEGERVDDAAWPDDGGKAEKAARRNVVRHEFLSLMKNRVARVASAVVAEHVSVFFATSEVVCDFALSAISVLKVNDYIGTDSSFCHDCPSLTATARYRKFCLFRRKNVQENALPK